MSYASGYSLDLYCDRENDAHEWGEFPHNFSDEEKRVCWRRAKKFGWLVDQTNGTAVCPKCAKKEADHG